VGQDIQEKEEEKKRKNRLRNSRNIEKGRLGEKGRGYIMGGEGNEEYVKKIMGRTRERREIGKEYRRTR
jgi:hypothetical protein